MRLKTQLWKRRLGRGSELVPIIFQHDRGPQHVVNFNEQEAVFVLAAVILKL